MDIPIGNIIAAVAVLLIHIEMTTETAPNDDEEASGAAADQARRQRRERDASVEAVHVHRLGEDEAPDEQEDDGIGERRERLRGRSDLQHDGEQRPEQRRDGERKRLGDPEHDDQDDDGRQAMRLRRERCHREGEDDEEQERRQRAGRRSSGAG